jgi:hypothetical protein
MTWNTAMLPDMNDLSLSVDALSSGGYLNVTGPLTNLFNLTNVPNVTIESIRVNGGSPENNILFGRNVTVKVNSTNFGQNATLFCIVNSVYHPIGFTTVFNGSSPTQDYYHAEFTWNSVEFTRHLLENVSSTLYDPDIHFHVSMSNEIGRNGTATSQSFHLYNTPDVEIEIPTVISNDASVNVSNPRDYIDLASVNLYFMNGTEQVNLSLLELGNNNFSLWHDFSYLESTVVKEFNVSLTTNDSITRFETFTTEILNQPAPSWVNIISQANEPAILSGMTTFTVNSSIRFSRARFVGIVDGIEHEIGSSNMVVKQANHSYRIGFTFDSLECTRNTDRCKRSDPR